MSDEGMNFSKSLVLSETLTIKSGFFMKIYLVLGLIFVFQMGTSQVVVDSLLPEKYEVAKTRFSGMYRQYIDKIEENWQEGNSMGLGGLVLCVTSTVDTLNKGEIIPPKYSYERSEEELDSMDIQWCGGDFQGDTLVISIGVPFGNQFITHSIKGDFAKTTFKEKYKRDFILKLQESDTLTNELDFAIEERAFSLSNSTPKKGDVVYGFCDFSTPPYFVIAYGFYDGQTLKIKRNYKYYFKLRIRE
jgi:hypothetical protein